MAAGVFDLALFAQYRLATGESRRLIGNRLYTENIGLVKTLVDQVLGKGKADWRNLRLPGMGTKGFRGIDFDEAMSVASVAFTKALRDFNPEKGKIAPFLKWKIVYELQELVSKGGLSGSNRGEGGVEIGLTGDAEVLDRLGGSEEAGVFTLEGITAEDIEEWERTGQWPESLEKLRRQRTREAWLALPRDVSSMVTAFLEQELVFRPAARVAREALFGRWESFSVQRGGAADDRALRAGLATMGAKPTRLRVEWEQHPVQGYARVGLRTGLYSDKPKLKTHRSTTD